MGSGIAQLLALRGIDTVLADVSHDVAKAGRERALSLASAYESQGLFEAGGAQCVSSHLQAAGSIDDAVVGAEFRPRGRDRGPGRQARPLRPARSRRAGRARISAPWSRVATEPSASSSVWSSVPTQPLTGRTTYPRTTRDPRPQEGREPALRQLRLGNIAGMLRRSLRIRQVGTTELALVS